jgi:hypothetical protein
MALDGSMMSVEIKGPPFEPGVPKSLFQTGIAVTPTTDRYAVTADGQRFLIVTPVQSGVESAITVVLDWIAELEQN